MSMEEFKSIFWWNIFFHWQYHDGRFVISFAWFAIRKKIYKVNADESIVFIVLGGLQGVIGWWMVKRFGKNPNVSLSFGNSFNSAFTVLLLRFGLLCN